MRNKLKYFGSVFFLALLLGCGGSGYKSYQATNVSIDSAYNSPDLETMISPYREGVESTMNEEIGFADSSLLAFAPESPLGKLCGRYGF